jgi:hypothetical protein
MGAPGRREHRVELTRLTSGEHYMARSQARCEGGFHTYLGVEANRAPSARSTFAD